MIVSRRWISVWHAKPRRMKPWAAQRAPMFFLSFCIKNRSDSKSRVSRTLQDQSWLSEQMLVKQMGLPLISSREHPQTRLVRVWRPSPRFTNRYQKQSREQIFVENYLKDIRSLKFAFWRIVQFRLLVGLLLQNCVLSWCQQSILMATWRNRGRKCIVVR